MSESSTELKFKAKFVSPLEKVFYFREPKDSLFETKAYWNETLSFQFCFQAEKTALVYIEMETNAGEYVQLRYPKAIPALVPDFYCDYREERRDGYRYFTENAATYYPDKLEEIPHEFTVRKNWWFSIWITVNRGIPVGEYSVKIKVKLKTQEIILVEKKQSFSILSVPLEKSDIPVSCWMYYDCLADAHRLPLFGEEYFEVLNNYFTFCTQHDINTVFVPLFSHPKKEKGGIDPTITQLLAIEKITESVCEYRFDFTLLDRFLTLAIKTGMRFFEFSHIASQQGAHHCPKIMGIVNGREEILFDCNTQCLSKEYLDFLMTLYRELVVYLKSKGIYEKCYFHISDEPPLGYIENYMSLAKYVRKLLPDANIIDALHEPDFAKEKVITPVASTQYIDKFIQRGVDVWAYYCCEEDYNNLSNRFFNSPLLRTRVLGVQLYLNETKGFLHWALNYWYDPTSHTLVDTDYVADGNGVLPAGDCFIVYPGKNRPISSIRQEAFSDGIRDYRTLKTLEKYCGKPFVMNLLKNAGFSGFDEYTHSETDFIIFLEKIQLLLQKVSNNLGK